jgi:hypothetical protein
MTLISLRWRDTGEPPSIDVGLVAGVSALLLGMPASWVGAQLVWQHAGGPLFPPRALGILLAGAGFSPLAIASLFAPWGLFIGLRLVRVVDRAVWAPAWVLGAPWCVQSLGWLLPLLALLGIWLLPLPWVWFGLWPLGQARPRPLHRARWATRGDLRRLLVRPGRGDLPPAEGLVLGRMGRDWLAVHSRPQHRERGDVAYGSVAALRWAHVRSGFHPSRPQLSDLESPAQ